VLCVFFEFFWFKKMCPDACSGFYSFAAAHSKPAYRLHCTTPCAAKNSM
jgi:hypothetical protein